MIVTVAKIAEGFLSDPEIPAIARELRLQGPPVQALSIAEYDS